MIARRTWAAAVAALLLGLTGCGGDAQPTRTSTSSVPEENLVYPISHILLKTRRAAPLSALAEAIDVLGEVQGGRSFAEVARDRSQDPHTAPSGGFMGFFRSGSDEALNAAVQAIPMGAISSPIELTDGVHIVHRHTFEEGRELEAREVVVAQGFFVPWSGSTHPGQLARDEARELATRLVQDVQAGTKTLASAFGETFGEAPPRDDLLIGVFHDVEKERDLFQELAGVSVGAFIPVAEFPDGFAVIQRGPYFRMLVRQILIQHIEVRGRPLALQRSRAAAKRQAEEVVEQLAPDGSNWAELVKRYSDDALSIPLRGFIGCASNGDLVPRLEAALREAPVGVPLRQIVETERGFHILFPVK